ncbi:hypothetical protein QVA66_11155 [Staphylococcus chromogenes]|nr:hypothetical protein [Staphylococcus chromogenes]
MGFSAIGIIVPDLFRPVELNLGQRVARFLIEDGPFTTMLCAVGFMIAAYHRRAQENQHHSGPLLPAPLSASVRRMCTAFAGVTFGAYLLLQIVAHLQFTLLPLMAAALLLIPFVASMSNEVAGGTGVLNVLLSGSVLGLSVLPSPWGPPYPMLAGLSFAVLGVLIERMVHDSQLLT